LVRVITPAPALNEEVPAAVIAPLCVMPTAVTVKEPLPKVELAKSIAFTSLMATVAPVEFRVTEPVKSLDWVRVISPVPALNEEVPVTVIAPVCVMPTAFTVKVPFPKEEEPKPIAFISVMATVAPVEFNATEPMKSLLASARVITPAPALKVTMPAEEA